MLERIRKVASPNVQIASQSHESRKLNLVAQEFPSEIPYAIRRTIYKIAIYIRLSKEDADRGFDESESIKNQKTLLTEYVKGLGEEYILIDTYIDQGYTGTNFKRPAFQRMVQDIETRQNKYGNYKRFIPSRT